MELKKIIYVDVDGTICDTPFQHKIDEASQYSKATPHYARIDVINDSI